MPAKAMVPVEALSQHRLLSRPWAAPTESLDVPPAEEMGHGFVGAGHARESDGSG